MSLLAGVFGCECDCLTSTSTVRIDAPARPLVPVAVLEGTSVADVCQGLVIDATGSLGDGGRGFNSFEWSISSGLTVNGSTGVSSFLDSSVKFNASAAVLEVSGAALTGWYAAGVRQLVIILTVRSFLGVDGTSSPFTVLLVDAQGVPTVSIVGGLAQIVRRPSPFTIEVRAAVPTCVERPVADNTVTYAYASRRGRSAR